MIKCISYENIQKKQKIDTHNFHLKMKKKKKNSLLAIKEKG